MSCRSLPHADGIKAHQSLCHDDALLLPDDEPPLFKYAQKYSSLLRFPSQPVRTIKMSGSSVPLSPSGPGGLLHNYGINYNMLETILPNYGIIRRVLSRKVGIDISSVLGVAFIGYTLTQTFRTLWQHFKNFASSCSFLVTSSITLPEKDTTARNVASWAARNLTTGSSRHLSAESDDQGSSPGFVTSYVQGVHGNWIPMRDGPDDDEDDPFDGPKCEFLPSTSFGISAEQRFLP